MASLRIGVLALQGAFHEHILLLRESAAILKSSRNASYSSVSVSISEVRTAEELRLCDALIIPGGESTTMSLVAARSGLLDPLREYVKVKRKPVWGTCAGLILLAESANRTKSSGQELIGGLDVRVNRNHFGRQTESFEAELDLPFLDETADGGNADHNVSGMSEPRKRFRSVFIRAPVVEKILAPAVAEQTAQSEIPGTIIAPSKVADETRRGLVGGEVEIMARLPGRASALKDKELLAEDLGEDGDIIAVRQGNVFGTSFHPELTGDQRIHVWWLQTVIDSYKEDAR